MVDSEGASARDLDQTPTWAVSVVCLVIIMISILLEKLIHLLAQTTQQFLDENSSILLLRKTFTDQAILVLQCGIMLMIMLLKYKTLAGLLFTTVPQVHLAPGSKFDFQKYILRSLEDDFKVIVGISPMLWFSMLIFLLCDVHGWHLMIYISFVPLVLILAAGTKLQGIISEMAIEIKEKHAVVQGIPLVQVSDRHFWFGKPQLILHLIHFVLFQPRDLLVLVYVHFHHSSTNASSFLCVQYEFGLRSCFHSNFKLVLTRVFLGVGVQILCSYITLPLYALVTQMGSTMKRSIFDEQTSKALKQWHKSAVKKSNDQGVSHHTHTKTGHGSGEGSHPHGNETPDTMARVDIDGPDDHQPRDLLS
ncbi:hypothetical protein ACFE04_025852 [Oxalis oulophora]